MSSRFAGRFASAVEAERRIPKEPVSVWRREWVLPANASGGANVKILKWVKRDETVSFEDEAEDEPEEVPVVETQPVLAPPPTAASLTQTPVKDEAAASQASQGGGKDEPAPAQPGSVAQPVAPSSAEVVGASDSVGESGVDNGDAKEESKPDAMDVDDAPSTNAGAPDPTPQVTSAPADSLAVPAISSAAEPSPPAAQPEQASGVRADGGGEVAPLSMEGTMAVSTASLGSAALATSIEPPAQTSEGRSATDPNPSGA